MKVVQGDEVPLQRGLEYRGGMFHSRRLLEGQAGVVDEPRCRRMGHQWGGLGHGQILRSLWAKNS